MSTKYNGGEESALGEWLHSVNGKDVTITDDDWFGEKYAVVLNDGRYIDLTAEADMKLANPKLRTRRWKLQLHVEFKTHGASLPDWQKEQLWIAHQGIVRQSGLPEVNGQNGWTGKGEAFLLNGKKISVWYFGHYICRIFGGGSPYNCTGINWGKFTTGGHIKEEGITADQLKQILDFQLDPHDLMPMSFGLRAHTKGHEAIVKRVTPLGFEEEIVIKSRSRKMFQEKLEAINE